MSDSGIEDGSVAAGAEAEELAQEKGQGVSAGECRLG